jgi:hypothetical protein
VQRALGPGVRIGGRLCGLDGAHLFLERRNQARHDAERKGDPRDDRRLDDLGLLRRLQVVLRQRLPSQNVIVRSKGVWATAQKLA